MKINSLSLLLINPSPMSAKELKGFLNKTSIEWVPEFELPIGFLEIVAYLRQEISGISIKLLDIAVEIFEFKLNYNKSPKTTIEQFTKKLIDKTDYKPDIIGISVLYSTSFNTAMSIASIVKDKWPDATVVFGGNHATHYAKYILKNNSVDYVIRGEGELSFTDFIKKVQDGMNPMEITGVLCRENFEQDQAQLSPMLMDLDRIPIAAYDLVDMEKYIDNSRVSLMLSRGCPFGCTFCASPTVHGKKIRQKSKKRILYELNFLISNYGVEKVIIQDDLIAAKKGDFIELVKSLVKLPIKFSLPNGLSISVLSEELIDTLIELEIDYFLLSIESGSEYTLKYLLKKKVPLIKARRLIKYLREKNQTIYINFILGIPNETKELMKESIDFINTIDADWVYFFMALPLPGTEMFKQFISMGAIDEETFDWDSLRHRRRTFDTKEISSSELEKLVCDTNIEYNFFNNSNIQNKRYKKAIDYFDSIVLPNYPYHIVARYCRGVANMGLTSKDHAEKDFKECVTWIRTNDESKKLYESYGSKMPLLKPFF
tara:strand:+ start:2645 stop:4276 length:1632 start_codon:yes stop_codon:yes gene_type:complete